MHYPERLAEALIINVPFLIHAFFKMIGPFMDPVTRNKLKFNPKPVEDGSFTADELFKENGWGGARNFVWDHEKYWGAFLKMCNEIREGRMARWRKLGACVGCDERDYKMEDFERTATGSPVTEAKAKAEAESEAEVETEARAGEEDGDRVVAEDAAPESGDTVEDPPVSPGQTPNKTSATDEISEADGALEPTAI